MRKMNKHAYNALKTAIHWYMKDKDIDIYEKPGLFDKDKPLKWQVNWAALGSVSPAEAESFAEDLKAAANLAQALNEMELEYDYFLEDPKLDRMIEDNREMAKDMYDRYIQAIIETLPELTELDPRTFEPLEYLLFDFNWRF